MSTVCYSFIKGTQRLQPHRRQSLAAVILQQSDSFLVGRVALENGATFFIIFFLNHPVYCVMSL